MEPSKSQWSFPVVLIRKRDSSLRFIDWAYYRELNKRTIKNSFPRNDEPLDLLAGAKYLSCLDSKNSYWQMEMEEVDEENCFWCGTDGFLSIQCYVI